MCSRTLWAERGAWISKRTRSHTYGIRAAVLYDALERTHCTVRYVEKVLVALLLFAEFTPELMLQFCKRNPATRMFALDLPRWICCGDLL